MNPNIDRSTASRLNNLWIDACRNMQAAVRELREMETSNEWKHLTPFVMNRLANEINMQCLFKNIDKYTRLSNVLATLKVMQIEAKKYSELDCIRDNLKSAERTILVMLHEIFMKDHPNWGKRRCAEAELGTRPPLDEYGYYWE